MLDIDLDSTTSYCDRFVRLRPYLCPKPAPFATPRRHAIDEDSVAASAVAAARGSPRLKLAGVAAIQPASTNNRKS